MLRKNKISSLLVIFGVVSVFIIIVNSVDSVRYSALKRYQLILLEDSCSVKVRQVSFDRGWVKVIGADMDSLLLVDSHNYSNEERYGEGSFGLFIKPGDLILKHFDNDTFFVHRDGREYFFVVDYSAPLDPNVVNR